MESFLRECAINTDGINAKDVIEKLSSRYFRDNSESFQNAADNLSKVAQEMQKLKQRVSIEENRAAGKVQFAHEQSEKRDSRIEMLRKKLAHLCDEEESLRRHCESYQNSVEGLDINAIRKERYELEKEQNEKFGRMVKKLLINDQIQVLCANYNAVARLSGTDLQLISLVAVKHVVIKEFEVNAEDAMEKIELALIAMSKEIEEERETSKSNDIGQDEQETTITDPEPETSSANEDKSVSVVVVDESMDTDKNSESVVDSVEEVDTEDGENIPPATAPSGCSVSAHTLFDIMDETDSVDPSQ